MNNSLIPYQERQMTPAVWQMIQQVAPVLHGSRLFGVANEVQATAIMLAGHDLGLPFTTAFDFVKVILGKPSLIPRGQLALIYQSGLLEQFKVEDKPGQCTVYMRRVGGIEYTVTTTIDDAKRAGLVKAQSGWDKWPANMLRWLAIGFCSDVVFPDVSGGLRSSIHYGAVVDEAGNVVDVTPVPVSAPVSVSKTLTLQDLLNLYPAEQIMDANGGKIPASDAEVEAVFLVLGGAK